MITSLIIVYFIIGCGLTYYWYQKAKNAYIEYYKSPYNNPKYSEQLILLITKIIFWPIILLIYIEI